MEKYIYNGMNKKEASEYIKTASRDLILRYINQSGPSTRKNIFDNVALLLFDNCKYQNIKIKQDQARSFVGSYLNELLTEQLVALKGDTYTAENCDNITVSKDECKTHIIKLLQNKNYKKTELFKEVTILVGADKTVSTKDDQQVKTYVGQVLSELVKGNDVTENNGEYTFVEKKETKYKKTPMTENEFKAVFLQRLHDKGGLFFEKFLSNLLEKYFTETGRTVLNCEVVGGSDDGGIDVKIKILDGLGFVEDVVVQAKCRKNIHVTEKEIRGFYGAMHVAGGSRGIFATTSTFHANAKKLLKSLDNCVGIDGDKVFELSKMVKYGIRQTKTGFIFDDLVFEL